MVELRKDGTGQTRGGREDRDMDLLSGKACDEDRRYKTHYRESGVPWSRPDVFLAIDLGAVLGFARDRGRGVRLG